MANNPVNAFDVFGANTPTEEEATLGLGGGLDTGGASQAIGLLNKVREAVETFNGLQEFTADLMDAAEGDSTDLYIDLLAGTANVLSRGLGNWSGRLGAKAAHQFEMHHIFPPRPDLNMFDFAIELMQKYGVNASQLYRQDTQHETVRDQARQELSI